MHKAPLTKGGAYCAKCCRKLLSTKKWLELWIKPYCCRVFQSTSCFGVLIWWIVKTPFAGNRVARKKWLPYRPDLNSMRNKMSTWLLQQKNLESVYGTAWSTRSFKKVTSHQRQSELLVTCLLTPETFFGNSVFIRKLLGIVWQDNSPMGGHRYLRLPEAQICFFPMSIRKIVTNIDHFTGF